MHPKQRQNHLVYSTVSPLACLARLRRVMRPSITLETYARAVRPQHSSRKHAIVHDGLDAKRL